MRAAIETGLHRNRSERERPRIGEHIRIEIDRRIVQRLNQNAAGFKGRDGAATNVRDGVANKTGHCFVLKVDRRQPGDRAGGKNVDVGVVVSGDRQRGRRHGAPVQNARGGLRPGRDSQRVDRPVSRDQHHVIDIGSKLDGAGDIDRPVHQNVGEYATGDVARQTVHRRSGRCCRQRGERVRGQAELKSILATASGKMLPVPLSVRVSLA